MNEAVSVLIEERQNLEEECKKYQDQITKFFMDYGLGGQVEKNNLPLDRQIMFDSLCENYKSFQTRLQLYENFVNSRVSSNGEYKQPLNNFEKIMIKSDGRRLNNGNISDYIKIGNGSFELPFGMSEMAFGEYSKFYSEALTKALIASLGENMSYEDVMKAIKEACSMSLNPAPKIEPVL